MSSTNSKAIICIGYGIDEKGKITDDVKKAQGPKTVEDGVVIKATTYNIIEEDGKIYRTTLEGQKICEIKDQDRIKELKALMAEKTAKKTTRKRKTKTSEDKEIGE